MFYKSKIQVYLFFVLLNLFSFVLLKAQENTELYSKAADEYLVNFNAVFITDFTNLEQIQKFSNLQKADFEEYSLKPVTKFIFGPLTYRQLGGEQKGFQYNIKWNAAYIENYYVVIPYEYTGHWLLNKKIQPNTPFELPLPYNIKNLKTNNWKNCTDPFPDHQDFQSFWYYWDPTRTGCDHRVGKQFQMIQPQLSRKTEQTKVSYPEYSNMIKNNKVSMTFAFGYVEDPIDPQPFKDNDEGIYEFRSFVDSARKYLSAFNYSETTIYENEYLGVGNPQRQIGARLSFKNGATEFEVKIVAAGSIDQMELFAKSFARDHDAFFGWFGHSRVGNGFDAFKFNSLVRQNKQYYSVVADYQLIYWAGCNSYSYYTKPFFDFKANLQPSDNTGTKALDIISNGLPSYFSLNAANAEVLLQAIVNLDRPTSYQKIIDRIERQSNSSGIYVLVNVLGDEDNK